MENELAAIIPAAGLSSRMGELKALLPLGETTVLGHIIKLFQSCGISDIIVVTGHRAEEVEQEAVRAGARAVHNADYEQGMFTSIKTGIRALRPETRGFFLLPVDIPLIRRGTIRLLAEAFTNFPLAIVYPVFHGRRGHPPLITTSLSKHILNNDGPDGLRGLLEQVDRQSVTSVRDIEVPDANILFDMDTMTDYRSGIDLYAKRDMPTIEECSILLHDLYGMAPLGLDHAQRVADLAAAICAGIAEKRGQGPDRDVCRVAGLLHDIAKGHAHHEEEGGRWLRQLGFDRVADIVAAHKEAELPPGARVTEKEIVYLADKMVSGNRLVSVENRFRQKLELYAEDPAACAAITRRLLQARKVMEAIEIETGCSLDYLISQCRDA
ncbi:MAG: NTP transferase domain-containing protein [Proteobacteria bacterium]|nr:NTP transferase domain-containing protein [Pseudomonadota bacterium]MBU4297124.1 NTP transferase domain-containing protein [Pseudomonadota bacterium]MCG2746546.1 NTP transferase domain-containing protein [Desulfobulbaceae bacterium]